MSLESQSHPPTNRLEFGAKIIAIAGGIVSALGLIWTLQVSTEQNETELKWKKSNLAKELIDSMLSDPQAMDAMRMIDWNGREFDLGNGQQQTIYNEEVQRALDPKNDDNLFEKDVSIREYFDRLFYHMGRMERSLRTNLIKFEDVRSPLNYYAGKILACPEASFKPYMTNLMHDDALKLLDRFDPMPCKLHGMPTVFHSAGDGQNQSKVRR